MNIKDNSRNNKQSNKNKEYSKAYKYDFPIIAIGASAGGLKAFEFFFSGVPSKTEPNMAFVLVQHISPDHKSRLVEIIGKYTKMNVSEISDGLPIQVNNVYIIPASTDVSLHNGVFKLKDMNQNKGTKLPINYFFNSISSELKENTIGVILSGSGSDGTFGLESIKRENGLVIVQDPALCEYEGMPMNAIETGLVDYILPANNMYDVISDYIKATHSLKTEINVTKSTLDDIFDIIYNVSSIDFSQYKKGSITRRIQKRMYFLKINDIKDYAKHLKENTNETSHLVKELLIGVTEFFRDTEIFELFEKKILPEYLNNVGTREHIRIWVAGCSTGEEAYSLAILINEYLIKTEKKSKVSIFATDIDASAIAKARTGLFANKLEQSISAKRLAENFTIEPDGQSYRIKKSIRDMLFFSVHNVLEDPPFSKVDIVSCRNVMIYFDERLQKKLLSIFHYALKENGILFLGISERIANLSEDYEVIDQNAKVFRTNKKHDSKVYYQRKSGTSLTRYTTTNNVIPTKMKTQKTTSISEDALRLILAHTSISGIIVNEEGTIIYLQGQTGDYLDPVQGTGVNGNVFQMTKDILKTQLIELFSIVRKTKIKEKITGIELLINDHSKFFDLTITPLNQNVLPKIFEKLYLILIETSSSISDKTAIEESNNTDYDSYEEVARLKHVLSIKEKYNSLATQELLYKNEDYESMKEEMQSVNEELQSSNEELETTTEELQSINEELNTINAELNDRIEDLSKLNNDFENLIDGARVPLLFLNKKLKITRLTKDVSKIFNVLETDIGRPLSNFTTNFLEYDSIVDDCKKVLQKKLQIVKEVQLKDLSWYSVIIKPYLNKANDIMEGITIIFIDITSKMKLQKKLNKETKFLNSTMESVSSGVISTDQKGTILLANKAACKLVRLEKSQFVGKKLSEVFKIKKESMNLTAKQIETTLKKGDSFPNKMFVANMEQADGNFILVSYMVSSIKMNNLETVGSVIALNDFTDQENKTCELELIIKKLQNTEIMFRSTLNSSEEIGTLAIDKDYRYYFFNESHSSLMKSFYNSEITVGSNLLDSISIEDDCIQVKRNFDLAFKGKTHTVIEPYGENKNHYFETIFSPLVNEKNIIIGASVYAKDITERLNISSKIEESEERFRQLYSSMNQGLALHEIILDDKGHPIDYIFLEINKAYTEITGLTKEDTIGKRVTEVLPDVEKYWIDLFGSVALTGEAKYFENYAKGLNKHFATYSYSPQRNQFAVLVSDITDRLEKEKQINFLSYNDQLTGVYNRRFYEKQLDELDNKENLPISLIMGDVNGLKLVNDSFGHLTGDELLIKVALCIKNACRDSDIISRIGGDEFVIILPKTNNKTASKIVDRINDNISQESVESIRISISFGYGTKKDQDIDFDDLFKVIEDDMYRNKLNESNSMRSKTVDVIQATLYEKNPREMNHSGRVGLLCEQLAIALKYNRIFINQIKTAGVMHDIGKIGINENTLNSTEVLSEDEWKEVKRHSEIGYRILSSVNEFADLANCVLEHHENFDGSGYPNGLKGKEISIQGRIIRICDAYDAMTGPRTYRDKLSREAAIDELKKNAGIQFDPRLTNIFINKVLSREDI